MNYKENKKEPEQIKEPDLEGVYTYTDYLTWEMDYMVELIRGKVFKMTPAPSSSHQTISAELTRTIANYLKIKKACKIFAAPFDVILPFKNEMDESNTVVQPDLCVICNPAMIKERGCFGTPDWIIEIISKSTSRKDLQIKYQLYEEAGVQEYWIVNPFDQLLEVFLLRNGKYIQAGKYSSKNIVCPIIFPDCEIDLKEVFE